MLFDDWFFSSIGRDPTTFGNTGKTIDKTYTGFVTGISPLGNRAYLPLTQDAVYAAARFQRGVGGTMVAELIEGSDDFDHLQPEPTFQQALQLRIN